MDYDLTKPIKQMKEEGQWPLPWTSAVGLLPAIRSLGNDVVGCELGVSYGFNLVYTLDNAPNIKKVYAIDPYMPYEDGPGNFVTQEIIDKVKSCFLENIEPHNEKVSFINKTSDEAHELIEDNTLDYIFIDGDHSYEAVVKDIANYYSKVKSGGVFSGHDFGWEGVQKAVGEFLDQQQIDYTKLKFCSNDVWYIFKP